MTAAKPGKPRIGGARAPALTSGYTESALLHANRIDDRVDLLSKPYTREDLARKVRQVLAKKQQKPAPAASKA